MGSKDTRPSDILSNGEWQRLRRRQVTGQPTPFNPNLPPPTDDMPMGEWALARNQQVRERPQSDGGVVHNDWGFREGQGPMTIWRPTSPPRK